MDWQYSATAAAVFIANMGDVPNPNIQDFKFASASHILPPSQLTAVLAQLITDVAMAEKISLSE